MFVLSLKKVTEANHSLVGGKAASLGNMLQSGIQVPPGFAVTTKAFRQFITNSNIQKQIITQLRALNPEDLESVASSSKFIQELILSADISEEIITAIFNEFNTLDSHYVAVRSSAVGEDSKDAAWAGQLESYLNTTKETLIENVKNCWASLFSPRAIMYLFNHKINIEDIAVGVVVQAMVQSEVSGVAFSVHPVTLDIDQVLIEAGFGLGEAVVSGEITPDSFVIDKQTFQPLKITINEKIKGLFKIDNQNQWQDLGDKSTQRTLDDIQLETLSKQIVLIESHYGYPVDIEWAIVENNLYILQARPITTLDVKKMHPLKNKDFYFSWGERHSVISAENWIRSYIDTQDVLGNDNRHVFVHVENKTVSTYNSAQDLPIAHKNGEQVLKKEFLPNILKKHDSIRDQYHEFVSKCKSTDYQALDNQAVLEDYNQYLEIIRQIFAHYKLTQPEYMEVAHETLVKLLSDNLKDPGLASITLTTPTELDIIKEEELHAYELSLRPSLNHNDLEVHAKHFPWLFWNTYDQTIIDEFLNNKFLDLQTIDTAERKEHIEHIHSDIQNHKQKVDSLLDSLTQHKEEITYLHKLFCELAVDRLKFKACWTSAEYNCLNLFKFLSQKANLSLEDFFASYNQQDIRNLIQNDTKLDNETIQSRKQSFAVSLSHANVSFHEHKEASSLYKEYINKPKTKDTKEGITGVVANSGKVKAEAYIVKVEDLTQLVHDMKNFKEGQVLVTTMTQPTMMSLARKASAIVTNEGGITSHASILAREFNIPCIVGTHVATKEIQTGDIIEVDANQGTVKVIEKKKTTS